MGHVKLTASMSAKVIYINKVWKSRLFEKWMLKVLKQ